MKTETSVGLALGTLLAALSVGLNVLRGDPHLVLSFPSVALLLVPALAICIASRSRRGTARRAIVAFGLHIATVAALTFAVLFAFFAWLWLASASVHLMLFGFVITFAPTLIVGALAAAGCGRFLTRSA